MAEINDILLGLNPWWKEDIKLVFKHRELYGKMQKFIPLRQIIALTGLRRTGKTTLMLKIAEDFIRKGGENRNVIYFSFDELRNTELRTIIKEYEKLTGKDCGKGRYLILLDEIQKLSNWEGQLKSLYDSFGKNVKIIISGSESLFIKKKSKETLAGRLFEFKVDTLTFGEFLQFKGVDLRPISIYGKEMQKMFDEFLFTFGFPEMVGIIDKEVIKKYVKEGILEKVVYRDIPQLFGIKDTASLESLLRILSDEPGQIVEIGKIAKELNISRQTAADYLRYLEESFLVRKLYNFSRSKRKVERKLKKYYPAVISPELMFREDKISKSRVFEWLVANQLKAEFFWRDPYKNEVDVVMVNKEITPVEIKYGKVDFHGISAFMRKFNSPIAYVISVDKEGRQKINGKNVFIIPAFKFLLQHAPKE